MKTIYKTVLFEELSKLQDHKQIKLPGLIKILKIGKQHNKICLWYVTETSIAEQLTEIKIRVAGTGHLISDKEYKKLEYLDTLNFSIDYLIFHFFRVKE